MRSQFGLMAEIEWILLVMIYKELEKKRWKGKGVCLRQKRYSEKFAVYDERLLSGGPLGGFCRSF